MATGHIDYIWEQLYGAVSSMLTDDSSLEFRLLNAIVSRLHRIFPDSVNTELPEAIREKLKSLEDRFTKHGSFQVTIEKMEELEVKQSIEEIFSLFNMVARLFPET